MGKSTPKPISARGYIQKGLFPKKLTASKKEGTVFDLRLVQQLPLHGQKTKRLCKTVLWPRRMDESTPKPISASGYIQKGLFPKKLTASKKESRE